MAAPMIYFDNFSFQLEEVQRTAHALKFNAGDQVYYATLEDGFTAGPKTLRLKTSTGDIYSVRPYVPQNQTPVYEAPQNAQNTNQCIANAVTLQPGNYVITVKGGKGGMGGGTPADGATDGLEATESRYMITLSAPSVAYAFQGGNGNAGGAGTKDGNAVSAAGGGASGAPSAVIICPASGQCNTGNSQLYISQGGNGGRGAGAKSNMGQFLYGRGGGGGHGSYNDGENGFVSAAQQFSVGGGGGGAPNGLGGAGYTETTGSWYSLAGQDASATAGGAGGRAYALRNNGQVHFGEGGAAGQGAVQWTCGGHALYSYGGGSGGGLATRNKGTQGGSGGNGAGTQLTNSYVRIYSID